MWKLRKITLTHFWQTFRERNGLLKKLLNTVSSEIEAAASNYFDDFFGQNLLSKNCVLLRLLFEGGFYLRAASNTDDTVYGESFIFNWAILC